MSRETAHALALEILIYWCGQALHMATEDGAQAQNNKITSC